MRCFKCLATTTVLGAALVAVAYVALKGLAD
jgi:hypothetical protein